MNDLLKNKSYLQLLDKIGEKFVSAQTKVVAAVNFEMLRAYWEIGQHIVYFEQDGKVKADYGEKLLERLSKDLSLKHGRGFSRSNLNYMRLLFLNYPICETLSHKLTWSHYCELLKVDD